MPVFNKKRCPWHQKTLLLKLLGVSKKDNDGIFTLNNLHLTFADGIFAHIINQNTISIMKNSITQMAEERRRLTRLRNRELLRDYKQALKDAYQGSAGINRRELVRKVLLGGKPLYYVDFDHAYNVIMHINQHSIVSKKTRLKQAMWMEIYHKVKAQQEKRPSLSLSGALARVLATERASRYFISEGYAYKYLYTVCRQGRAVGIAG